MNTQTASDERSTPAPLEGAQGTWLLDAAVAYVEGVRANREAGEKFGYGSAEHRAACERFFKDERAGRNDLVRAAFAYVDSLPMGAKPQDET